MMFPFFFLLLCLVCVIIPAAIVAALPPSAFAQQEDTSLGEEEEEREDLAGDNIVSDVLDSVEDGEENDETAAVDGDINRQTAVPIINQDQGAANLALNEALDVTVVEPRLPPPTTTPPPPDDGGQEPECSLEITTDKETYGPGDTVAITITNTGDVSIEFPGSFLGLEIRNLDTEEVLPLDPQPVVVTFEPGASATFQFTYEELVSEIGTGLISATVVSECGGIEEVAFRLSEATPPPRENGKIAFASTRDGIAEIYVMNADGSNVERLTNNDAPVFLPSWSPDGTKIAFTKGFGRSAEIYVMNADGSEPTQLTNNGFADHSPRWSPDGTKIAFESDRDAVNNELTEIYVMNADGSEQTRLTNNLGGHDQNPSWSPDGTKIAFASQREGDISNEIYVMNADGSEPTQLTNNPGPDVEPDWSPDGTKIVFANYANSDIEIYVMNADGSEPTQLTNDEGNRADFSPRWSPDGTKIVFGVSISLGNGEIYVMNADGSEQTNISNHPASDSSPDWGPAADSG